MKNILLLILISSFLIYSCDFVKNKNIADNYYLNAIDLSENQDVSYKLKTGDYIIVVKPLVFAVGNNNQYIYVKQYPFVSDEINKNTVNYFIIPIKNDTIDDYNVDLNKLGPFTATDFKKICDSLGINPIFKKVY